LDSLRTQTQSHLMVLNVEIRAADVDDPDTTAFNAQSYKVYIYNIYY